MGQRRDNNIIFITEPDQEPRRQSRTSNYDYSKLKKKEERQATIQGVPDTRDDELDKKADSDEDDEEPRPKKRNSNIGPFCSSSIHSKLQDYEYNAQSHQQSTNLP